jgi:hypothetical protein
MTKSLDISKNNKIFAAHDLIKMGKFLLDVGYNDKIDCTIC